MLEALHEDILQLKTNSNTEIIRFLELLNNDQIVKHNEKQESSPSIFNDNNRISSQLQHPKCITVQTSFAINSSMPRVPTKSTVIAMDEEEDDEKSYDNYIETSQHIITTNEQFENILSKDERKFENSLFLKVEFLYRIFYSKEHQSFFLLARLNSIQQ